MVSFLPFSFYLQLYRIVHDLVLVKSCRVLSVAHSTAQRLIHLLFCCVYSLLESMSGVAHEVVHGGGGISDLEHSDGSDGGGGFRIGDSGGGGMEGGGRDRFGDYGVGDISRLIDELMRSEPGVRGAPPASPAVIGALEEFTYGDDDTAAPATATANNTNTRGATGKAWCLCIVVAVAFLRKTGNF